jgi:hypothetical protein
VKQVKIVCLSVRSCDIRNSKLVKGMLIRLQTESITNYFEAMYIFKHPVLRWSQLPRVRDPSTNNHIVFPETWAGVAGKCLSCCGVVLHHRSPTCNVRFVITPVLLHNPRPVSSPLFQFVLPSLLPVFVPF